MTTELFLFLITVTNHHYFFMIEVFESDEEFSSFEEEFEEAPEELPKASQGTVTRELTQLKGALNRLNSLLVDILVH